MELSPWGVRASAGTVRAAEGVVLQHVWTEAGVVAGPAANGAQLLHLSVAVCVLNDTYREARRLGLELDGVLVEADGGRIELSQRSPAVFSILLNAVPKSLDPNNVLPQGALVSVGRRRRF